jgi:hypothetical protein
MRKTILFTLVLFISALTLASAQDAKTSLPAEPAWKKELSRDVVTVKDGLMTMDEGGVLTISTVPRTTLHVRIKSEAPVKGPLSRDNFVTVTTALYNSIFIGVVSGLLPELPAAKIGSVFDFRNDSKAKDKADITIAITMDGKGLLLHVTNSHNSNVQKYPLTWDQYFSASLPAEEETVTPEKMPEPKGE